MPPRTGQLSTGSSSSAAVSAAISPPWATSTTGRSGSLGPPFGLAGDQLGDQRQAARGDVDPALAAVRCPRRVVAPGQPGTGRRGVDLAVGHALPVAEVRLPQPVVDPHLQPGALPQRDRGVVGAAQVRRHDQQRLAFAQHLGGSDGLGAAEVAEVGVELALHPAAER